MIAASATNLAVPLYIRNLVDIVMVEKNLEHLNSIALAISLLFLVQLICQTIHNYLFDVTEKRVIADFRIKLFNHLHKMSVSYFVKRRTGEVMSRMTNDVTTIENIVTDLPATMIQTVDKTVRWNNNYHIHELEVNIHDSCLSPCPCTLCPCFRTQT